MGDSVEPFEPTPEPQQIRASDADRNRTIERLTEHMGTGRLTLAEFEQRAEMVVRSKYQSELAEVTADLPAEAVQPDSRRRISRWFVAVFGGSNRRGRFRLSGSVTSISVCGGDAIDLRGAEIDGDQVVINAYALFGGADIFVPDSVEVSVTGFALFGGNDEHGSQRPARPGAPLVRIRAWALFGGIDVWRVPAARSCAM